MTFGLQCDEETSRSFPDRAAEGGIDFVDASNVYSLVCDRTTQGRTEDILRRWLCARRDEVSLGDCRHAATGRDVYGTR